MSYELLATVLIEMWCAISTYELLATLKYLTENGTLPSSPAASVTMPRKEKKSRVVLRPDEYNRLLSLAGSNARDFSILQFFLQTGIRVSELVNLTLEDIDLTAYGER